MDAILDRLRYRLTRPPKNWGWAGDCGGSRLEAELKTQGFDVEPIRLDPAHWRGWLERALPTYRGIDYYGAAGMDIFMEKALEHYMAARLLDLAPGVKYIDVASDGSPTPEIYEELYGCQAWRQDLRYLDGIDGRRIGGNAARIPLPDGFADAMALHCSFEHFEGDSDSAFIREAERLLAPGGRVVIAPLYLSTQYLILTDPGTWRFSLRPPFPDDPEAHIYFLRGWKNRHGRFYSPTQFARRVRDHLGALSLRLLRLENAAEADPACYLRHIAVLEKNRHG